MKKLKYLITFVAVSLFSISVQAYDYNAVSCGNIKDIPGKVPDLVSFGITLVQIAVPVVLVVISMIDLVKAVSAQKEDEIKKGQQMLIKRIITAAIVFVVIALVKLVISVVANSGESSSIIDCIDCFVEGSKSESCIK